MGCKRKGDVPEIESKWSRTVYLTSRTRTHQMWPGSILGVDVVVQFVMIEQVWEEGFDV